MWVPPLFSLSNSCFYLTPKKKLLFLSLYCAKCTPQKDLLYAVFLLVRWRSPRLNYRQIQSGLMLTWPDTLNTRDVTKSAMIILEPGLFLFLWRYLRFYVFLHWIRPKFSTFMILKCRHVSLYAMCKIIWYLILVFLIIITFEPKIYKIITDIIWDSRRQVY